MNHLPEDAAALAADYWRWYEHLPPLGEVPGPKGGSHLTDGIDVPK